MTRKNEFVKYRLQEAEQIMTHLQQWRGILVTWLQLEKVSLPQFQQAIVFLCETALINWAEAFLDLHWLGEEVTKLELDVNDITAIISPNLQGLLIDEPPEKRASNLRLQQLFTEDIRPYKESHLKDCVMITDNTIQGLKEWQETLKAWLNDKASLIKRIEFDVAFIRLCRSKALELIDVEFNLILNHLAITHLQKLQRKEIF